MSFFAKDNFHGTGKNAEVILVGSGSLPIPHHFTLAEHRNLRNSPETFSFPFSKNDVPSFEEDFPQFCHCNLRHFPWAAKVTSLCDSNPDFLSHEESKLAEMNYVKIPIVLTSDMAFPKSDGLLKAAGYSKNQNIANRRSKSFEHLGIFINDLTPQKPTYRPNFSCQLRHYPEAVDARNLHESNPDFRTVEGLKASNSKQKCTLTGENLLMTNLHSDYHNSGVHQASQRRRNVSENLSFDKNKVPSLEENFHNFCQSTVRHYQSKKDDPRNQHESYETTE